MRQISAAGINLFQLIYILIRDYSQKSGLPPLNLSLGNPDGVPPQAILNLQARFVQNPAYPYHTYAEDNNIHRFTQGMVSLHGHIRFEEYDHLKAVPIPGIKGATTLLPLACGLRLSSANQPGRFRVVSNMPAYDVFGVWSQYLGIERIVWPLASHDNMRLNFNFLKDALKKAPVDRPNLIHVIRPGNPAAVGATALEWRMLIEFCLERGIRLVNDAAYAGLAGDKHTPLALIAKDYPELEWLEMYSVSKSFSDPGARLGAIVGSKDFVEDYVLVKGNTDSGPVPSIMAAYGEFFEDQPDAARRCLDDLTRLYVKRLQYIVPSLKNAGLQEACATEAGFFTLWKAPKQVFGIDLSEYSRTRNLSPSEGFNRLVISETGIAGVHFEGPIIDGQSDSLIRYAVCADVLDKKFQERFQEGLQRLRPQY
ncbi:MAG: pyridoxal phosphate-dependent aminotransferase [Elusimicrobia bacterium]|nr:pyridoxal phosphate-dependent aminotransferase [Elusimicrobiota bacterium]